MILSQALLKLLGLWLCKKQELLVIVRPILSLSRPMETLDRQSFAAPMLDNIVSRLSCLLQINCLSCRFQCLLTHRKAVQRPYSLLAKRGAQESTTSRSKVILEAIRIQITSEIIGYTIRLWIGNGRSPRLFAIFHCNRGNFCILQLWYFCCQSSSHWYIST